MTPELVPLGRMEAGGMPVCVWPPQECRECKTARCFGVVELGEGGNVFRCFKCAEGAAA